MLAADKALLLSGYLGGLPDAVALRLAKAVEVDRLAGGKHLPHDEILAALRPQLRHVARARRTATPLRYFCQPFEDLLFNGERTQKQKGRIARGSITPVWEWLAAELIPEEHAKLTKALREAILKDGDETIYEICDLLWSSAATAIQAVLQNDKRRAAAARALGGVVMEDVDEIALMLSAAHDIAALQAKLPRPITVLTDDIVGVAHEAYDKFAAGCPDIAPYVILMIMPRLERVWEIFRLVAAISRQSTDTLIANTDLGIVGDLLFADLETHVAAIRAIRANEYDGKTLIGHVGGFSELSTGMVKELGIRREGKWGQRLSKGRADVSRQMETLIERAPKEIFAALPQAKASGFGRGGARPLDIARPPDADRVFRAMRAAQLLIDAKPYATAAAYIAKLDEAMNDVSSGLREAGEDVLREVRAADPEHRAAAERHLAVLFDLCNCVLGEEETDLLRRRSKVAAATG
jgi:hypothetical protein